MVDHGRRPVLPAGQGPETTGGLVRWSGIRPAVGVRRPAGKPRRGVRRPGPYVPLRRADSAAVRRREREDMALPGFRWGGAGAPRLAPRDGDAGHFSDA